MKVAFIGILLALALASYAIPKDGVYRIEAPGDSFWDTAIVADGSVTLVSWLGSVRYDYAKGHADNVIKIGKWEYYFFWVKDLLILDPVDPKAQIIFARLEGA